MSELLKLVGTIVVAVEGVTGATRHIGEAIGVQTEPTVLIRKGFGDIEHWAGSLVRPATKDEEIAFWKDKVRKLEEAANPLVSVDERKEWRKKVDQYQERPDLPGAKGNGSFAEWLARAEGEARGRAARELAEQFMAGKATAGITSICHECAKRNGWRNCE